MANRKGQPPGEVISKIQDPDKRRKDILDPKEDARHKQRSARQGDDLTGPKDGESARTNETIADALDMDLAADIYTAAGIEVTAVPGLTYPDDLIGLAGSDSPRGGKRGLRTRNTPEAQYASNRQKPTEPVKNPTPVTKAGGIGSTGTSGDLNDPDNHV